MIRSDAFPETAYMIEDQAVWDRTEHMLIRVSVRDRFSFRYLTPNTCVSVAILSRQAFPTRRSCYAVRRYVNEHKPKQLDWKNVRRQSLNLDQLISLSDTRFVFLRGFVCFRFVHAFINPIIRCIAQNDQCVVSRIARENDPTHLISHYSIVLGISRQRTGAPCLPNIVRERLLATEAVNAALAIRASLSSAIACSVLPASRASFAAQASVEKSFSVIVIGGMLFLDQLKVFLEELDTVLAAEHHDREFRSVFVGPFD